MIRERVVCICTRVSIETNIMHIRKQSINTCITFTNCYVDKYMRIVINFLEIYFPLHGSFTFYAFLYYIREIVLYLYLYYVLYY